MTGVQRIPYSYCVSSKIPGKDSNMCILLLICLTAQPVDIFDPAAGSFLEAAGNSDQLFAAADSVYRIAEYETAASLYLQGLRGMPSNSGAIYNLACCYGLLDRADLASVYLLRAWDAGFQDIEWAMGDPDFDNVRQDGVFSSLVDSLAAEAGVMEEALGGTVTFYADAPFACRVKLPDGYDGSEPVPLVVGIHGYGGSPEQFIGLWRIIGDYGCIFACPQGPVPFLVGDRIGYSWYTGETPEERHASAVASRDYVLSLLDTLEEEYSISEVFLFGYSQGGGITYLTGLHAPDRFAAIAPFSGWLDLSVLSLPELRAADRLPVRIVHGDQDRSVEFPAALQADSVLSSLNFDVELFSFQGEHMFSQEGLVSFMDEFLAPK